MESERYDGCVRSVRNMLTVGVRCVFHVRRYQGQGIIFSIYLFHKFIGSNNEKKKTEWKSHHNN